MRISVIFSLVVVIAVGLVTAKAEVPLEALQAKEEAEAAVQRALARNVKAGGAGSASADRLASWSKADPESDVVRPKNRNREGRKGKKGNRGTKAGGEDVEGEDGDAGADEARRLDETKDPAEEVADKRAEMERRREELRAQKQQEIRDRYKRDDGRVDDVRLKPRRDRESERGRDPADFDPERYMRDRDSRYRGRSGESEEDYLTARHKEIRDRHRSRDRSSGRDRSGRRDRKRPDSEGRHAVLRRRIEKHANLFTPEELAEIDDDLKEHKKREDKLDAARDKLNAQFDAVRDIDDRDDRLERLEELKQKRAAGRDAERAARDQLREDFQLIREKLEAKLRTELRL